MKNIILSLEKVGKRGEASEYIVNKDIIKSFGNTKKHTKIDLNTEDKNFSNNLSNKLENLVINLSNKLDAITLKYNDLYNTNQQLITKINNIETLVINLSNKNKNFSTETDSESEIDIEKESYLYNIKNILEKIYNKNLIDNSTKINEEKSEEIGLMGNPISENDKEENNLNIEEVGLSTNPTSDKTEEKEIENNNTFQLSEVGMLETKETNNTPTMNAKFNYYFNDCIKRMNDGVTTIVQLNEKLEGLSEWVRKHNNCYTKEEYTSIQKITLNRYQEIKEQLETANLTSSSTNEEPSIEDEFFNYREKKEEVKKEQLLPNVRIASTKEELIADLEEYKNYAINQENLEDVKQQFKKYCKLKDKAIVEYNLTSMVVEIVKEIDTQIEANKTFLTTFNIKDKESITDNKKTQEIASCEATKGIVGYRVDETEDYPF